MRVVPSIWDHYFIETNGPACLISVFKSNRWNVM